MIRGIVFDLFDTLVDQDHSRLVPVEVEGKRLSASTPHLYRHLEGHLEGGPFGEARNELSLLAFAELQREVDRELFERTLKRGIELATEDRFAALLERLPVSSASDAGELALGLTAVHMGVLREAVTIPIHHEAILATLATDYRLGICSNFSHAPTARALLDDAGFSPHLEAVLISEETGIRKPRWEIFAGMTDLLGLEPEEILHIGDSLTADVAGAAASGMKTVWLTRRIEDPDAELEKYAGPRPDFALEDLVDLPVLLARLSG